ncbi:hypothetical protein EV175_003040 [Coemansia sp. RSA 1933]|nr:hypothetical protein EV175_003040 [Coemansia sp. RSA 1933]
MYRLATRSTAIADSLAPAFEPGSQKVVLSKLSSRIQNEFVGSSNLEAIDASIGTIKQRVQRWFSSGKIWKTLFMNVEEVSDDLVEDTVLDRSFEDADLAMIHASGRLNESIRNSVSELAEALERLSYAIQLGRQAPVVPVVDPSVLGSAKGILRALKLRKEPASQFSLARHVWDTRRALAESDTLTGVPTYIRSSLTGFWAINSVSILAGIGSWIYLDASLVYASSGAVALAIISLTWLKYRWRQLSLQIYRHLDGQNAVLARKVIDAHSSELQSKLDQPVRDCIGGISGIQQLAEMDSMTGSGGTDGALVVNAASWRSRLELLVYA